MRSPTGSASFLPGSLRGCVTGSTAALDLRLFLDGGAADFGCGKDEVDAPIECERKTGAAVAFVAFRRGDDAVADHDASSEACLGVLGGSVLILSNRSFHSRCEALFDSSSGRALSVASYEERYVY